MVVGWWLQGVASPPPNLTPVVYVLRNPPKMTLAPDGKPRVEHQPLYHSTLRYAAQVRVPTANRVCVASNARLSLHCTLEDKPGRDMGPLSTRDKTAVRNESSHVSRRPRDGDSVYCVRNAEWKRSLAGNGASPTTALIYTVLYVLL